MRKGCVKARWVGVFVASTQFFSLSVFAQSIDSLDGIVQNKHHLNLDIDHWYSAPVLMAGIKSTNNFGRFSQSLHAFKTRDEIFLGVRNEKGWGIYALAAASFGNLGNGPFGGGSSGGINSAPNISRSKRLDANDGSLPPSPADSTNIGTVYSRTGILDPSLAILHPVFDNGTIVISGQFRESFPLTDFSQQTNTWIQSYDSVLIWHMRKGLNFDNITNFRYYSRTSYVPPIDSFFASGLITSLNQRMRSWYKIGGGQRTQVEFHENTPNGMAAELFILADFNLTPKIFLGPRIHFPVAAQNKLISDAPTNPALANISAELYFQAAL